MPLSLLFSSITELFAHSSSLGRLHDRTISIASTLDSFAVDTWSTSSSEAALASLIAAIEVDVFEVECVNVAGNVSADSTSAVVVKRGRAIKVLAQE